MAERELIVRVIGDDRSLQAMAVRDQKAVAKLGTELEVETPAERTSAVVVRRPFIDPEKEIPKQDLAAAGAKDESSG